MEFYEKIKVYVWYDDNFDKCRFWCSLRCYIIKVGKICKRLFEDFLGWKNFYFVICDGCVVFNEKNRVWGIWIKMYRIC